MLKYKANLSNNSAFLSNDTIPKLETGKNFMVLMLNNVIYFNPKSENFWNFLAIWGKPLSETDKLF